MACNLMDRAIANKGIEEAIRERLTHDCPFGHVFRQVRFTFSDGILILQGRVPSFYAKQILQTRLREIEGIQQIDNCVHVISSTGLSSEPD